MTARLPTPMSGARTRLPRVGSIRMGRKAPKSEGGRKALDCWRFTSSDVEALRQVATLYGGDVVEWGDKTSPHTHELLTQAPEIRVALPPDACEVSDYTLWEKGFLRRVCDGETCEVRSLRRGPDGDDEIEVEEVDCMCWANQVMVCSQREVVLSVLLPEIRFTGTWTYRSKAAEMTRTIPASVELIRLASERGLPFGSLRIEKRQGTDTRGRKTHYSVAVLGSEFSMNEIAEGQGALGAGRPAGLAEGSGPVAMRALDSATPVDADALVVDAEVVSDESPSGPGNGPEGCVVAPLGQTDPGRSCSLGCGQSLDNGEPVKKLADGYAHVACAEAPM